MRFAFLNLKNKRERGNKKTVFDYKQEILVKHGAEQFKTLVKKGLSVPIVLL